MRDFKSLALAAENYLLMGYQSGKSYRVDADILSISAPCARKNFFFIDFFRNCYKNCKSAG